MGPIYKRSVVRKDYCDLTPAQQKDLIEAAKGASYFLSNDPRLEEACNDLRMTLERISLEKAGRI
jgi:hypothetical protein